MKIRAAIVFLGVVILILALMVVFLAIFSVLRVTV